MTYLHIFVFVIFLFSFCITITETENNKSMDLVIKHGKKKIILYLNIPNNENVRSSYENDPDYVKSKEKKQNFQYAEDENLEETDKDSYIIVPNNMNACNDEDMEVIFIENVKIRCLCNGKNYECVNEFIPAESLRRTAIIYARAGLTEKCRESIKSIIAQGWECICIREKTLWCW